MITKSCHAEITKINKNAKFTISLVGNPNVGKSTIFNGLTGLNAVTANYPGKTVCLNIGSAKCCGVSIGIVDLPGTYSLEAISEDQEIAKHEILARGADLIVVVIDASNLARNLSLVLELMDLELPLVIACNLMDVANKQKIFIDFKKLSDLLGAPIVPLTANSGQGLNELLKACLEILEQKTVFTPTLPKYNQHISQDINTLAEIISKNFSDLPHNCSPRAAAISLLADDVEFKNFFSNNKNSTHTDVINTLNNIKNNNPVSTGLRLIGARRDCANFLAENTSHSEKKIDALIDRLWRLTLKPLTGLPILIAGLIIIFCLVYFLGGFLSSSFDGLWATYASPNIKFIIFSIFGQSHLAKILLWGLDSGIQSSLSVGIPYILTFYLLLAFLEDTGYLNSIAFLTDSLMGKIGLHGKSAIPLITATGCSVPAIIGTKILNSKREKIIACTLITLVPCSARTAVIMGAVSFFIGWQWALAIYLIVFLIGVIVGRTMALFLPGKSSNLVMEIFPFRKPKFKTIAKKTWQRFREFLLVALPIISLGSLILGFLYETQYMWLITRPLSFLVEGWLGLPAIAGICLLFGILRKELSLQLLLTLAIVKYGSGIQNITSFMTKQQIFIFALVTALYIPCVATISVLMKELGAKIALTIMVGTIILAIVVGGATNQFLNIFKLI